MASEHCSFVALKTGLQHLHTTHLHQWLANGLPGWVAAFAEPWESLEDALTPTTNPTPHYKVLVGFAEYKLNPTLPLLRVKWVTLLLLFPPPHYLPVKHFELEIIGQEFTARFWNHLMMVLYWWWLFHWMITTMLLGESGAGILSISSLDGDDHGNNNGDWLVVFDFVILWLLRHIHMSK